MNKEKIIDEIGNYYNNLVNQFGHDPRSCDYGHKNSQTIKFEVLSQAALYDGRTILDIGCGFADYFDFLNSKYKDFVYHGVDISKNMIDGARKLHPNLNLEMKNVFDVPPEKTYNIVTSNGIFYLLGKDSKLLMQEFIEKMYTMSEDVVVFNSLSTWASDKIEGEFYADPLETVAFCRTLCPWVTLRHDYHPRDFTIYMYKKRNI